MSTPDPVPAYFSCRYVGWFLWSNAITGLMIVQGVFAALTLDPTLIPHDVFHWLLIGNAVLTGVIAQVKANRSPGPPPTKAVT